MSDVDGCHHQARQLRDEFFTSSGGLRRAPGPPGDGSEATGAETDEGDPRGAPGRVDVEVVHEHRADHREQSHRSLRPDPGEGVEGDQQRGQDQRDGTDPAERRTDREQGAHLVGPRRAGGQVVGDVAGADPAEHVEGGVRRGVDERGQHHEHGHDVATAPDQRHQGDAHEREHEETGDVQGPPRVRGGCVQVHRVPQSRHPEHQPRQGTQDGLLRSAQGHAATLRAGRRPPRSRQLGQQ